MYTAALAVAFAGLFGQSVTRSLPRATHASCSTPDPIEDIVKEHQRMRADEANNLTTYTPTSFKGEGLAPYPLFPNNTLSIPVYVHLITSQPRSNASDPNYVSDRQVAAQMDELNRQYWHASIQFELQNISRIVNSSWAIDSNAREMGLTLRQGNFETLNLYVQENLQGGDALGWCLFPGMSHSTPPYASMPGFEEIGLGGGDGCHIQASTFPAGSEKDQRLGNVAVHEIGHWFGLFHVFQDYVCDPERGGDWINDTPQQTTPSLGCAKPIDSCRSDPGNDNQHNFMDYVGDSCQSMFTDGQKARMRNMYDFYRKGK